MEFYAPWCGHCKQLAPEYEKAAIQLSPEIALAKLDCTNEAHEALCGKYGVKGFPTLKVFRNKIPSDYDGGRKADDIIKFMKRQNSPSYVEVKSTEDLTNLHQLDDLIVVGSFEKFEGAAYDKFIALAEKERNNYAFGVTTSLDTVLTGMEIPEGTSIILKKQFDEGHNFYTGNIEEEPVLAFLKANSFPIYGEMNAESYAKYLEREVPVYYFFVDPSDKDTTDAIAQVATDVGAGFKGKMSFVWLDGIMWERFMVGTFGVKTPPGAAIQFDDKVYVFSGDIKIAANVRQFAQEYFDKKLEPYVKSQKIPKDNSKPVTIVVGKEFEKIVFDETKDVMVEFYAPWCGHCKKMAPAYEKVGQTFAGDENVVVAKIDATENDHPGDVTGFPTLIFYPANDNKEGLKYDGDRSDEAIIKFINDNRISVFPSGAAKKKHDEL